MTYDYTLTGKIWIYPAAHAAWHFVSLPKKEAAKIKERFSRNARGWGSLPVSVTLGKTTWETSLFPEKKTGTYILPLKKKVRQAEDVFEGETITFHITIKH